MATDTMDLDTLPAPIQKELQKLDEARERLLQQVPHVRVAERILTEHRQSTKDYVCVGVASPGSLGGTLILLHVNHWRQVAPVLRALAKEGYHVWGKPEDFFEITARTWKCHRKTPEPAGRITLRAFVPSDGSGECRKEKTGTRTEDVYTWRCDNGDEHDVRPVETDGPT